MAFDRAAALADLTYRYPLLLSQAGIAATDTSDGVGPVLDEVATVATDDPDLTAATLGTLARYWLLDRIVERLAVQVNVATGGDSYTLNQLFTNAKALRDSLQTQIGWLALADVAAQASGGIVTVTAPYLNDPDAAGTEGWQGW